MKKQTKVLLAMIVTWFILSLIYCALGKNFTYLGWLSMGWLSMGAFSYWVALKWCKFI